MSFRPFISNFCKLVCVALLWAAPASYAYGDAIKVEKGGDHLVAALTIAQDGDVLILSPGIYLGNFNIDKSLTLEGAEGVVFDGGGKGSVIRVTAVDVIIKNIHILGSGSDHEKADSGIFLDRTAHRARIENNFLEGNLIGVYVWGQKDALVIGNRIIGRRDFRVNDRGNGVYIWNAPGAIVSFNDIRYGRDGIFVNASRKNKFIGNRLRDLRFAIHYMYTQNSQVSDNVSIDNDAGYSLMFSDKLKVTGNYSLRDKRHGILLNYANHSEFSDNKVVQSGDKCVFIYNSNKNSFRGNWFENCAVGVHFTGGSEGNIITGNSFIGSRHQVKYVGTKWVEWSAEGRGNYWSDNAAFDLNDDGISENSYKPNDMIDQIIWRHPTAKTLLSSPAVRMLRWAQGQFPAFYPGGVIDRKPLMKPVQPKLASYWQDNDKQQVYGQSIDGQVASGMK